ncbi:hypothetical protein E2C01_086488 [Portunus trituberculatus]|uniref:Uncharacterized protein n=1 Tax=Portunus trituberculatus TaxID=210409 RepID=A0A5B7J3Z3_PORTR|nr:hypothetical protein [Portunus trituberculatus]
MKSYINHSYFLLHSSPIFLLFLFLLLLITIAFSRSLGPAREQHLTRRATNISHPSPFHKQRNTEGFFSFTREARTTTTTTTTTSSTTTTTTSTTSTILHFSIFPLLHLLLPPPPPPSSSSSFSSSFFFSPRTASQSLSAQGPSSSLREPATRK